MVSTHVIETDSHDSDNLISLHVNGLSIYEPTRGQLIKTWKVPSSNGYYFHRVEFVSHSHHVEFIPKDKQPIDQVKENPTLHSLLIDRTLVTKLPPKDDLPDMKPQPTANFTSVIKRAQSFFGSSSQSATSDTLNSVITNVDSNRIPICDNNSSNNDKNNNFIDIAESSNGSSSNVGVTSNNIEKANFNINSSRSNKIDNTNNTKNNSVDTENNADKLNPNSFNKISSVHHFVNTIEPNKHSITSEESDGPRGIESDFRLQRIYGKVDKNIVRFGSYTVMERRRKHGAKVSPDPEIFNDIENASDWGDEEIIPKANDLTKKQISSLKKAMAEGRLFNMGASVIVKLFPKFSAQSIVTNTGKVKVNRYRCPLCPEFDANRRKIIRHIETEHTMNQIICITCKSIFTTDHSARFHICSDKKEVNNRSKPGLQLAGTSASSTVQEPNQSLTINDEIDKNDHEILPHAFDKDRPQCSTVTEKPEAKKVPETCEANSLNQTCLETLPPDENSLEKQSNYLELLLEHNYGVGGYEDSTIYDASPSAEDDFLSIQDIEDASIEEETGSNKKSEDRNYTPNIKNTFLERYHGTIDKRLARTGTYAVIQRRKNNVSFIQPDPNVFTDLDGVEEWNEKDIIPSGRELTTYDINRIKKGIKNGKLYNIGASLLVKIFPSLSNVNYTTKSGLIRNAGYKCPLCPKENNIKRKLFRHIEADHTMSLIICTLCRAIFTSEHNSKSHQCTSRPSTRASLTTQNDQDREPEVLQPINSSDFKDNPTTFITTIINSNKSNITSNVLNINEHNDTTYPSGGFSGSVIRTHNKSNNGEFISDFPELIDRVTYQPMDRGIKRKLSPPHPNSPTLNNNQGVSSGSNNNFDESDSEEDSSSSSIIEEEEDSEQDTNLSSINQASSILQNDDSWNWTYGYQTSKTNALTDFDSSLNDDEMTNLEETDESLRRIFGQIDSTQLPTRTRNCVSKRQDYVKHIQPEPAIFSNLEDVEEWKPSEVIPAPGELTNEDIRRIKKGISNGKLYNMGQTIIYKIFPEFTTITDPTSQLNDSIKLKCPVCPESFRVRRNVARHFETCHTMSLITCAFCQEVLTSERKAKYHRCLDPSEKKTEHQS